MPSFSETLDLIFHADTSGAIGEIKNFASESNKSIGSVEEKWKSFGSTALKLGGSGMAAGGFLTALGDKERQASEGLKARIQAAGQSYTEFGDRIEEAVKHQEHFGHTADETNNALSTLVGSFGDTNKALDEMQLVADLAAKKHISLADAAQIVAKAHGGAGRIFKEFNIQVKTNDDGVKDYDGALTQLSQKLSGQASASVAGFTGWLKGAAAAGEDFVASFGEKWGPAILGVSTGLTALGGITSGVGSILGKLKSARDLDTASTLANTDAVEANTGAQLENKTAGSGLGSVLGKAGIAAGAVAATYALYQYGQSLNKTTLDQNQLNSVMHASQDGSNKYLDSLNSLADGPWSGAFKDAIDRLAQSGDAGVGTLKQYRDHLASLGQDTGEVDAALASAAQSQDNLNQKTDEGTSAIDKQKKADEEAKQALINLTSARQKDLDLVNSQLGGELGLSNAQISTRKAIVDMTAALKDGTKTADEHTSAINSAESAIMNEATAAGQLAAKQAEAAGVTDTATASTQAQIKELIGVRDTLKPGSDLYNFIQAYIDKLNSIPGSISTNFNIWESVQTSSIQTGGPGGPKKYALGGMVDGPKNKPQLAILHGGEYVSTAAEVDAAGRPSGRGGAQTIVVPVYLDGKKITEVVVDGLVALERRDGRLPFRSTAA